jgi:hypothetical protein
MANASSRRNKLIRFHSILNPDCVEKASRVIAILSPVRWLKIRYSPGDSFISAFTRAAAAAKSDAASTYRAQSDELVLKM